MTEPIAQIKGVLFDMDGLLLDSEGVYTKVINEVLKPYGKEQTWDVKAQIMGKPEIEATETLLSILWPPTKPGEIFSDACPFDVTSFLAERNKNLDEEFGKVGAMPGAERLVAHLAKHKVPICVATGSKRHNFEIKTSSHGSFFAHFDGRVVCGDDARIKRGKPWPDVFLLAAREGLRIAAFQDSVRVPGVEHDARGEGGCSALRGGEGQFLVFEDGQPGVIAAQRAGMHSVWVPDPNLRALLTPAELDVADEVIDSLLDFKPEHWGLPPFEEGQ